jgi:ATP-dependent RNA helicase RhlE
MSFATLGLADGLLRAVADEGYSVPTPIQARAVPEILAGRDLLAAAQTGTGKTAAFTLPLLHKLAAHGAPSHRRIRVLVLVPTRELAAQVDESVRTYGRHLPQIRTALIFGGVSFNPQADRLRGGIDVVVATPGRLLDHAQQRTIDLSHVEVLVLDEADRMLDMGFIHDIRRVLKLLPQKRQNLMFSATFSDDIRSLAHGILRDPVTIDIAPRNTAVHTVAQRLVHCGKNEKAEVLSYLIRTGDWGQTLVFTRTKRGANKLAERLARDGITTDALHGNKSQNARTRALKGFKAGEVRVLVATDIAARGLDIDQLPHVVNFELPNVPEDYVHRIGRTGRAGMEGEALSLVSPDERDELRAIERMLKQAIPVASVNAEARQALASTSTRPHAPQAREHTPQQQRQHQHPRQRQQQRHQGQQRQSQGQSQGQRQSQHAPRHPHAAQAPRAAQSAQGQQDRTGAAPNGPPAGGFSGRPRRKFFSR